MPTAKETGKDFKPLPSGSHVARCFASISLGTQQSPMYPASFKMMLMWEVPGEAIEIDGKPAPMTISREYTLSLSEKANLRHDLQSWRGREFTEKELEGFQVEKVVGQPCMLSVIHRQTAKKKTYAAVSSIGGLPKGVQCPPQWHKAIIYEIDHGKNDAFNALPKWIQAKIEACEEWQSPASEASQESPVHEPEPDPAEEGGDSLVPF